MALDVFLQESPPIHVGYKPIPVFSTIEPAIFHPVPPNGPLPLPWKKMGYDFKMNAK
jgi:hypothetical protein